MSELPFSDQLDAAREEEKNRQEQDLDLSPRSVNDH